MAAHPSNLVTWLLEIDEAHLEFLAPVRHWDFLSMASGPGVCWVKGFRPEDLESPEITSIPFKRLLYLRDEHLFPAGGLVPLKQLPAGLAWIPLEKGLPLQLPSFNHNYFGIQERLTIRLVPASIEKAPAALLAPLDVLRAYADMASSIRLKGLNWVVLDDQALVVGEPLLPLPGEVYWRQGHHLLPAGFAFEFPFLVETIGANVGSPGACLLLWDKEGGCLRIGRDMFCPLSRSSVRQTTGASDDHNLNRMT
ncbi:hypothetical protein [Puia dinghuensis]|uniref:MoxR-vWA-beta-propeller ternary system domain-containing protein n=1 Tax=Puia dinghuensis TaxID=1792502 RepID=A0A8J2UA32_9BACT|nr:hypothetical protein [Puia dinghuensis]GGA89056.1 hypothetical protein GCM10011511_10390 [Puia dinghuensis]